MSASSLNGINALPDFTQRPVDTSVAYLLFWLVVNSDQPKQLNSNEKLKKYLATLTLEKETLQVLLNLARQQKIDDLIAVCQILKQELSGDEKVFLLQMAVVIASGSEKITPSANHILRFLLDLLALDLSLLVDLYHKETQHKLTEPEDLSSPYWWFKTEQQSLAQSTNWVDRAGALEILGLESEATTSDIKRAYRRMVQLYHPDRHAKGGQPSIDAAQKKFLRVQKAYEVLKLWKTSIPAIIYNP